MSKKSISNKSFILMVIGAIALAIMTSCSPQDDIVNVVESSDCINTGYDAIDGKYGSVNGSIILYFNLDGTMDVRQNGVFMGTSTFCFTPDGQYLKLTNEFGQVSYSLYSIVDMPQTKGIVFEGEFYELLNN